MDTRTGEVKEYNCLKKNCKDYRSLRKSLNRLFELLLCNLATKENCVCITLTYQKQMLDFEQMSKDIRNLMNRLRRKYGYFQYIYVLEPQTRASFHYHVVLCFDRKAPYIAQDVMNTEWKHGFSRVKSVKSDITVAKYFVNYNLDLTYEAASKLYPNSIENYHVITVCTDYGAEKRVKGIAFEMLPPMFNVHRHSMGIIQPTIYTGTKGELLSGMNNVSLRERKLLLHKDKDSQTVLNIIKYERYR